MDRELSGLMEGSHFTPARLYPGGTGTVPPSISSPTKSCADEVRGGVHEEVVAVLTTCSDVGTRPCLDIKPSASGASLLAAVGSFPGARVCYYLYIT